MPELDDTARYILKLAPEESIRWVLPALDTDLGFTRWLDTQTIAFPGETNRRCDTVAELVSRAGTQPPWALVLEAEANLDGMSVGRMLEYDGRLLRELRHGPHNRDAYLVAGVVLFLSGIREDLVVKAYLPGTDVGIEVRFRAWCLEDKDADATVERIGRKELGDSVLPWVALMRGGDRAAVVTEWVRLVQELPNRHRRLEYAGLAMVFATWLGREGIWRPALEVFQMEEIKIVREWKDKARREVRIEVLLKTLQSRFPGELPADIAAVIQQTRDIEQLARWFDLALLTPSLEAFRGVALGTTPSAAMNGTDNS